MEDTCFWRSVKRLSSWTPPAPGLAEPLGTRPAIGRAAVVRAAAEPDTDRAPVLLGGALVALAIIEAAVDFDNSGARGLVSGGGPTPSPEGPDLEVGIVDEFVFPLISRRGCPGVGLTAPMAGNFLG